MVAFSSRLFWKAFLSLLLGLLIWLPVFYWLTVPLINRLAYEVEESAGRTVLENVVQMAGQSHRDLAAWRQTALEAHQRELRTVIDLVESWSRRLDADVAAGRLSRAAARRQLLEGLRHLRYGNADYVWAADYQSVLVSHPLAEFHQRDASTIRDTRGKLVVPPMVAAALKSGDGYLSYWWPRLETGKEAEKLSYFRAFPAWQLVVGTGVYIDDVDAETGRRRTAMIEALRKHLHGVQVARSGYVFVIDGQQNVVVHPDPRVEGTSMASLVDPGSGRRLADEFIEAASRPDRTVFYRWNRPDDAEHYIYPKVAWIHYVPEYDWYLGASAYADDLGRSGHYLRDRILLAFLVGLAITALFAFVFIRRLTSPILRLAEVAQRHIDGDLSAVGNIERNDEIGVLARAFNGMVGRLHGQIEHLEERVAERTRELEQWASQLEGQVAERTAEARASEAKFRGLVEQTLAGIYILEGGNIRYANQELAAIFGYGSAAEIIDRVSVLELVAPEHRALVAENVRQRTSGQSEGIHYGFTGLKRDGSRVALEVHGRSFEFEGRPAVIGILLDVTERKQAEEAREQALAMAETLSRLKSEFMTNMSHELRTPLNGIIGMAHIGRRAEDLPKAQEACGHILESGHHLLQLVTAILDFSALETGRFRLQREDFELHPVIDQAAAGAARQAAAKGVDFRLEVATDLPRSCLGDAHRLGQILDSLLGNAVKFTSRGGIVLAVVRQGEHLVFSVSDTGIGMDPGQVNGLFHPFEQADGSATRRYGGMGLGLALAQRLATLMGGTIVVDSAPRRGSVFKLRLPLVAPVDSGAGVRERDSGNRAAA